MSVIEIKELEKLCRAAFAKAGVREQDADIATAHLMHNELSGRASHGMIRVVQSIKLLEKNGVPQHDPVVVNDTGSVVHMDAKGQMGVVAGWHAVEIAKERAGVHGIALAGIRNFSTSAGSMHYYLTRLTDHGLVAQVFCNSVAMVAPPGGRQRMIGTNPFGIGIPGTDNNGMIADFSTAALAYGKMMVMKARGEDVPEGALINKDGEPSTNSDDAYDGAILPLAGYQGFALGLMIELMAGPLIGAKAVKDTDFDEDGLVVIAIDPVKTGMKDFATEASKALETIRQSSTQPGIDKITLPGDRSKEKMEAARIQGTVDVADKTLDELRTLASPEGP